MQVSRNRLKRIPGWLSSLALGASLMFAMVAGLVGAAPSSVIAANPAEFQAARVTPADIQSFVALSFDPESAQILQAQALLVRSGLMPEGVQLSDALDDVMAPLGPEAPQLINPQAAMAIQPATFDVDALMGSFESANVGLDPSAASDIDDVEIDNLQGTTFIITADNINDVAPFLQEQLRNEAAKHGGTVATIESPEGTEILAMEGLEDQAITDEGLVIRAMATVDGATIFASTVEDVVPFAETAAGLHEALADDASYQEAMAAMPADVLLAGYNAAVDAEQIAELQAVLDAAAIPLALDLIVEPTGPTSMAVWAAEDGFRFEAATLPAEGSLAASPEPAATGTGMTLAQRVPADTMLLVGGTDLGASQGFRALEQFIALAMSGLGNDDMTTMPVMTEQYIAQQFAGLEMLLGFNLQTDFIQQLTGEFGFALSSIDLMNPQNISALFVSGVDDAATVDTALSSVGMLVQMAGADAPPIERVTVGDAMVNQISLDPDLGLSLQYGVVGSDLVVGLGDGLLQYALGPSSTLAESPQYQEVMNALPQAQTSVAYVDTAQLIGLAAFGLMATEEEFGVSVLDEGAVPAGDTSGLVDAGERCAEFATQAEAQAAYDADPIENFDLDFDFDGTACSDYFADSLSSPAATETESVELLNVNIGAFGAVGYEENGISRMSGVLIIPADE